MTDDLEKLEQRLRDLEKSSFTDNEREVLRFLVRVVKAIEGTLWLASGLAKLGKVMIFLAPFFALWFLWENLWQGLLTWLNQR